LIACHIIPSDRYEPLGLPGVNASACELVLIYLTKLFVLLQGEKADFWSFTGSSSQNISLGRDKKEKLVSQ
jgi:hypothetical protein